MDLSNFLPAFISESEDNLQIFEDSLVEMSYGNRDEDLTNTSFRAIHSIKGGAGMFDAQPLVDLVHITESVLDLARKGDVEIGEELLDTFFDSKDVVKTYLDQLSEGSVTPEPSAASLIQDMENYLNGTKDHSTSEPIETTEEQTETDQNQQSNTLLIEIEETKTIEKLAFD